MVIDGGDRHQRLRRATHAAHGRLNGLIDAAGLLSSRMGYERYLQAVWRARRPSEWALENTEAACLSPAWQTRYVCRALRQDIFDVSQNDPEDDTQAAPERLGEAEALGVLYVLEGSALGARLIETRVAAFGMTPHFGARHMAQQTSQPQAWPSLIDLLTRTNLTGAEDDLCIAAAVTATHRYETAFECLTEKR